VELATAPPPGHLSQNPTRPLSLPHLRTSRPLSLTSPSLRARQSTAATNHRRPSPFPRRRWSSAVLSATVSSAPTSATRDAPQFLLPLPISLCPRSPVVLRAAAGVRHRRPGAPLRHRRHRGVPGTRFEVRNLSRPLQTRVLPSAKRPAERPRPSSPASPPPRGRAPPPQLAVGEAKAGHPIPAVRPGSGGPVLFRPSPILAAYRRSNGPGQPAPRPLCPLAPPVSPPAPALPAGPTCQLAAPRCPPGPACQPLRPPRARAPARGSNPGRPPEIRRP
jgi:hypothetical protein